MSLKNNALISIDELLTSMQLSTADFTLNFMTIYNSSADASAATYAITSTGITLTVTGGANAHTNTLTGAANTTIGALITAIEALAKGWVITRLCSASMPSSGLGVIASTGSLLIANIKTLSGYNQLYLEQLINTSSQNIENYCGRIFITATYTEYIDGRATENIAVQNYPITAITSLGQWDFQSQAVVWTLTENTDYSAKYDSGIIYKYSTWDAPILHKAWKIVYTAGYTTTNLPDDLKQCCIDLCKIIYNKRNKEGYVSETSGGLTLNLTTADIPANIKSMLNYYKKLI